MLDSMVGKFKGSLTLDRTQEANCQISVTNIQPGMLVEGEKKIQSSKLLEVISTDLPSFERYKDTIWDEYIQEARINRILREAVTAHYQGAYSDLCRNFGRIADRHITKDALLDSILAQLQHESALGGLLLKLRAEKKYNVLREIFYVSKNFASELGELELLANALDPKDAFLNLENIDPRNLEHLKSVGLSPISIVHLYRQYFFEFDTFLGSPVGHIWLSPGSSVELIEVSTRKTIIEKTLEQFQESLSKTEEAASNKDEIAESVKTDNQNETKFGINASAHQGWIGGEANASASLDLNSTQQKAREESYKHMREQTKKLSYEIRQNFKSTFKTITETTDTSSKRYVLTNNSTDLVNYELRRKMRQVGVQVQDIGTYLCWQTYVDDPGANLGLGELVHIAKVTDVEGKPKLPVEAVLPEPVFKEEPVSIPFQGRSEDNDDREELYWHGKESNGDSLYIFTDFNFTVTCDKPNYLLEDVTLIPLDEVVPELRNLNTDGNGKFTIYLKSVHFHGNDAVKVMVKQKWVPDPVHYDAIYNKALEQYKNDLKEYNAQVERAAKQDYITAAKERIKLASKITQRRSEDLREEERIVVYRKLIQELLMKGISQPDDATRHVVAELINSIFDVEKMLYFVSPEWWRPRLHQSHQNLGVSPYNKPSAEIIAAKSNLTMEIAAKVREVPHFSNVLLNKDQDAKRAAPLQDNVVGWGGVNGQRKDNYYITEDSDRAKLGSSLGWLLQLDGDNLRNAFLNAPWVKAVIPIRPGKEEAALNWLQNVEGTNGIGSEHIYYTDNPNEKSIDGESLNGMPMLDVLKDLCKKVNKKYREGLESGKYPKQDPADPQLIDTDNVVTSTPVDRVYEHGFYPLVGGFRNKVAENDPFFMTIAQWTEILPTDQVVAVEVEYDPKTGRQK